MARVSLSTDAVPAASRLDYWQSMVCESILPLEYRVRDGCEVHGRVEADVVGSLKVLDIAAPPGVVLRTPKLIRRSESEVVNIYRHVGGQAVWEQGGRQAVMAPGDLAVVDPCRPYSCHATESQRRLGMVMVPRSVLPLSEDEITPLTAVRIPGSHGAGALASSLIGELVRHLDDDEVAGNFRLSTAVVDVIAAVLVAHAGRTCGLSYQTRQGALLVRVKAFIEQHLSDSALTVTAIAAAHHISTRQLQKLFEANEETVTGWTRQRRLEGCRKDLLDPCRAGQPVAAIGARWGYHDASVLSRMFRATYGLPPGQYRAACSQAGKVFASGQSS